MIDLLKIKLDNKHGINSWLRTTNSLRGDDCWVNIDFNLVKSTRNRNSINPVQFQSTYGFYVYYKGLQVQDECEYK